MSTQIITTTKTKRQPKPKRAPQRSKTSTAITTISTNRRKSRRKNNNRATDRNGLPMCYVRNLEDPFNNPPCKLGFGTMVDTDLSTLYYRSVYASHSDGTLAIFVNPAVGGPSTTTTAGIHYNAAGGNTTTWSHVQWDNYTVTKPLFSLGRVISCAIKVTPLVADTSSPPVVYAGCVAGLSTLNITALTPNQMLQYPSLERGITRSSIMARSRPVDMHAYEFTTQITGNFDNLYNPLSLPVVILTGLTGSINVTVDVICHIEYIPVNSNVAFTGYEGNSIPTAADTVANYFPSLDSMWRFVSQRITSPGFIPNSIEAALNVYANTRRRYNNRYPQMRIEEVD